MNAAVKVVQPSGILDGTQTDQFRQEIRNSLDENTQIILVDFKDITFMDSSGLGALVLSLKAVRSAGAQMILCSLNEQIKILFDLTSMDKVFEIFPDREAFEQKYAQQ
ncbi:MAG: STAS domain-containing protein [Cyanophyceae cyanobacterium]